MPIRSSPDQRADARFEDALAHADALYAFARRLTGNGADAEDLVQETYARALRAWDPAAIRTSLVAWLFRILRNAHLDRLRRQGRSPLQDGADDLDSAAAVDDGWLRDDFELERMRGLVAGEIEAALARLTDDARAVVLLDVEGFTETETAEILGCAVGTVKSRLARARAALRADLADYARGDAR